MAKALRLVFKVDTLSLVECIDGFWLYDTTRGMNIAVRAKTEQEACINALLYYQKRLKEVESDLESLDSKVQDFLAKLGIE
jgi:hypothetical protein